MIDEVEREVGGSRHTNVRTVPYSKVPSGFICGCNNAYRGTL